MNDFIGSVMYIEEFTKWILSQLFSSFTFALIKFLLGTYAIVLLIDIVLMLIQRGVSGDLRDTIYGMNIPAELVNKKDKSEFAKKWEGIRARISSGNESEYKVAVIEGDKMIDNLISRMGYKGENFGERLDGINPGQIENIEDLKKAHLIRNQIIHDDNFSLPKEEAEEIIGYFEEFLKYHQVLD